MKNNPLPKTPAPQSESDLDLLIVGALACDEDVVSGQAEQRLGGAVYFGGHAALAAGARTGIWTALAPEDMAAVKALRQAGLAVQTSPSQHSAGIRNIYTSADRDRRTCQVLGQASPLIPEDLQARGAQVIHIAPLIAGEVPYSVLIAAGQQARLGLDAQGVLRVVSGEDLVFRDWAQKKEGLAMVHYLKCDAAEAEVLTGLNDPPRAARALAQYGPREVVVTRSDAVWALVDGQVYRAPFSPRQLSGRTGRGDTCMASFLARRIKGDEPEQALPFAAALTSLKMEKPGPFQGSRAEVEQRMHEDRNK